jgi:hypothetical protein
VSNRVPPADRNRRELGTRAQSLVVDDGGIRSSSTLPTNANTIPSCPVALWFLDWVRQRGLAGFRDVRRHLQLATSHTNAHTDYGFHDIRRFPQWVAV